MIYFQGLNVGTFYTISTLMNQSLVPYYPTEAVNIGRIGSVIVISGMFGSVACGLWLSKTRKFKLTLSLVYSLSFCGMLLYSVTIGNCSIWVIFFVAAFMGFFMTGYLPLGFEYAAEITYPVSEDIASSFLNCSAQIFGIMMTLGIGQMLQNISVISCNITLTALMAIGSVVTCEIISFICESCEHCLYKQLASRLWLFF
ncbi:unnamed protein product [Soboliphyme baturini]|uniref:MFS domain-containing protein n=1 Tax=Soboliphyme baturini TaxID=241478 RepID=A0A183IQR0_9BILA|nr:unnamed protein product [Soboliphyme baturini]